MSEEIEVIERWVPFHSLFPKAYNIMHPLLKSGVPEQEIFEKTVKIYPEAARCILDECIFSEKKEELKLPECEGENLYCTGHLFVEGNIEARGVVRAAGDIT